MTWPNICCYNMKMTIAAIICTFSFQISPVCLMGTQAWAIVVVVLPNPILMLTHHWKLLLTSGHITDSLFVMIGGNCNLKRGSSSFNRTHQFAHIDSVQCTNRITFLGPKAFTIVDQDTGQSFQYDNNKTHIFLQSINLSNDKKCDEARS